VIIFVLALIVLGPEKLPRVVSEIGRWVGRARVMARQFREQLEEEVQLEQARKAQTATPPYKPPPETQPAHTAPGAPEQPPAAESPAAPSAAAQAGGANSPAEHSSGTYERGT
jgi:sec-independent protein translocase protein TatB